MSQPVESSPIARIQRIVGKHRNNVRMPLENVRYWLNRALEHTTGSTETKDITKDLDRMREQLERDLGASLAEIVTLSKRWPM